MSYQLAWVTRHCPGHYIKVSKHITQARQGLFVDEQRGNCVRGKAAS
jgi:hypothetical protein